MENNEIMERLLQDDKDTKTTVEEKSIKEKSGKNGDSQVSRIRIVSAKYKVYIVLLLIFICLLGLTYIPRENDSLNSNKSAYNQAKSQLTNTKRDIDDAKKDMNYLSDIVNNEEHLKKCLNSDTDCSTLPEGWITSGEKIELTSPVPLSYLQTTSLYNEKMSVDEKMVLRNLNEYLIKQNISGGDKNRVGEILRIQIGDPEIIGYRIKETSGKKENIPNFFEVNVDVQIEFSTVKDLVGFLYNVEKKLIDNGEYRILYKIQSVSYDIISRDEPQITDISMIAYYYHDDRFDNAVIDNETNSEIDDSQTKEGNDSDSIVSEVFGN